MKILLDFVLDGSRDPLKQTKAHETGLKQPQNKARLSPKLTPIIKRDRIKV
jgi:hypothetical protein